MQKGDVCAILRDSFAALPVVELADVADVVDAEVFERMKGPVEVFDFVAEAVDVRCFW